METILVFKVSVLHLQSNLTFQDLSIFFKRLYESIKFFNIPENYEN